MKNSKSFSACKKNILKFIWRSSNSIFNCHGPNGIKLIITLTLDLDHLRERKFRHIFQDTLNPICSCGDDIETTVHYLLHCPNYLDKRRTLLKNLQNIGENISDKNDFQISELLLFGVSSNNDISNTCILNATIQYILATKIIDVPLSNFWVVLKDSHFWIHTLTRPSPTMVHTRFNDNRLFVSLLLFSLLF